MAEPKSIPDWSYAEDYYEALLQGGRAGLAVVTDPVKGKGLVATKAFAEGDTVLREPALCCSQNLDEFKAGVPVCPQCLTSLESPQDIVRRVGGKGLVSFMPKAPKGFVPPHREPCRNAAQGCTTQFCSPRCEGDAWESHHSLLCSAMQSEAARAALTSFVCESWVQDGVDFTDTHFLGLRFMALATCRHRLKRLPLEQAYAPVGQLIRTPLTKLHFTYLLAEEYEADTLALKDEPAADARKRRWQHFLKHKSNQAQDPIAEYGRASGGKRTKAKALEQGVELMQLIFNWDEEETAFFTPQKWSELLGAVLLNGQERSPNSEYVAYQEGLKTENKAAISAFHKKVRQAGKQPELFHSSSHGQGIYPVGACFNHNCDPNIQVSYVDDNNETLQVSALRPIADGEELCISYIDEAAPVEERQQQLFEHYLFTCACAKCEKDLRALGKQ